MSLQACAVSFDQIVDNIKTGLRECLDRQRQLPFSRTATQDIHVLPIAPFSEHRPEHCDQACRALLLEGVIDSYRIVHHTTRTCAPHDSSTVCVPTPLETPVVIAICRRDPRKTGESDRAPGRQEHPQPE